MSAALQICYTTFDSAFFKLPPNVRLRIEAKVDEMGRSGTRGASGLTGSTSPLTRDFIDIGRVSCFGDTGRMRKELRPSLKYRTVAEGLHTL